MTPTESETRDELRERAEKAYAESENAHYYPEGGGPVDPIEAALLSVVEDCAKVDPLSIDCPYPSCGAEAGRMCWGNGRPQFAHNSRRSHAIRRRFGLPRGDQKETRDG